MFFHAEEIEQNKRTNLTVGKGNGENLYVVHLLHFISYQNEFLKDKRLAKQPVTEPSWGFSSGLHLSAIGYLSIAPGIWIIERIT